MPKGLLLLGRRRRCGMVAGNVGILVYGGETYEGLAGLSK